MVSSIHYLRILRRYERGLEGGPHGGFIQAQKNWLEAFRKKHNILICEKHNMHYDAGLFCRACEWEARGEVRILTQTRRFQLMRGINKLVAYDCLKPPSTNPLKK